MAVSAKTICALAVFIAILFTVFQTGELLRCYECNSHTDKNCSDKIPPNSTIKDCSTKKDGNVYTMCRKIRQSIEFEVNGLPPDTRIIRSCAWDDSQYKNTCYQRSGFGGRQDVCSCSTDLCNFSNIPLANYMTITAGVFGIIVFYKLNY